VKRRNKLISLRRLLLNKPLKKRIKSLLNKLKLPKLPPTLQPKSKPLSQLNIAKAKVNLKTQTMKMMINPLNWSKLISKKSVPSSRKRTRDRKTGLSRSRNKNKKRSLLYPGMRSASSPNLISRLYRSGRSSYSSRMRRINLLVLSLARHKLKRTRQRMSSSRRKKRHPKVVMANTPTLRS